jgi:hypothetical protein
MNQKLENIANKVVNKMGLPAAEQNKYGSVVLIIMVVGIILSLIRVIQECENKKLKLGKNKHDQAKMMQDTIKNICIKKNILNQWRLNRIIKQKLSPENYKVLSKSLKTAIMDVGVDLTEDELLTLMEASNNV